jgi:ABC-type nitrate/sulfonate/bicarbonate transport system substrate-binding protein
MRHRQTGQVMIILLGGMLLGGGGSALVAAKFLTGKSAAELREQSLAMTEDKARRENIEDVFKRLEREVKSVDEARAKNQEALRTLMQKHDPKPGDVEAVFAEVDASDARGLDAGLDMRFALRGQLTAEQWRALFPQ